jgi:Flp pilus assembly protein CpaB
MAWIFGSPRSGRSRLGSSLFPGSNRRLFVAAGLFSGSLVSALFLLISSETTARLQDNHVISEPEPSIGTVGVFYPRHPVARGTKIEEIHFDRRFLPSKDVPPDAIRRLTDVAEMYSVRALPASAPILRSQFSGDAEFIRLTPSENNRALTIEVDRVTGIENWAWPGLYVDVVLTKREGKEVSSMILVRNARILSVAGNREMSAAVTKYSSSRFTLTLDVTVKDALSITVAREIGQLSLFMRGSGKREPAETEISSTDIFNPPDPPAPSVRRCSGDSMRMDNKEYLICDSGRSVVPVEAALE